MSIIVVSVDRDIEHIDQHQLQDRAAILGADV